MSTFIHFHVVLFDVLLRSTKRRKLEQSFLIFQMSSLLLCVRNRSKLFIALYIGMHNKISVIK